MKKLFTIFTVLLTVVLGAVPAEKIFEADYRTGKADAAVAKGDPAAKFTGQPEFTPQGLVVGKGKTSLRYNTAGNLNTAAGAIEISFDSGNLNWNNATKLILLQSLGKNLTLYIYKHSLYNYCFVLPPLTNQLPFQGLLYAQLRVQPICPFQPVILAHILQPCSPLTKVLQHNFRTHDMAHRT